MTKTTEYTDLVTDNLHNISLWIIGLFAIITFVRIWIYSGSIGVAILGTPVTLLLYIFHLLAFIFCFILILCIVANFIDGYIHHKMKSDNFS